MLFLLHQGVGVIPRPFAAICGTVTLNNVAENAAWTRQDRSATMSALLYSTPPDSPGGGEGADCSLPTPIMSTLASDGKTGPERDAVV